MDKIDLNGFLQIHELLQTHKTLLEISEKKTEKELSKLRKKLDKQNWMSKKDNFLYFSIYEYGEDYEKQHRNLDFLREQLKRHTGQYM